MSAGKVRGPSRRLVRGLRMDVKDLPVVEPWAGAGVVIGRYALVRAGEADPFTGEIATGAYVAHQMDVSDVVASLGPVIAAAWEDEGISTLTVHPAGTVLRDSRVALAAAHHVFVDRGDKLNGPVIVAAGRLAELDLPAGFVPVPLFVQVTEHGVVRFQRRLWLIGRVDRS